MTEPRPSYQAGEEGDEKRPLLPRGGTDAGMVTGQGSMNGRERAFWIGLRKALIELIRAIEVRYSLESAIVTNEQRKWLRRHGFPLARNDEEVT